MSLQAKFRQVYEDYNQLLQERQSETLGLLLAVLSRSHLLLLGPRGTAKSLTIRLFADAVEDAVFFKRQLTRFSVMEDVWGPIRLSALKEDRFERVKEGTLATAHFGYLDEVWKCNASLLNSLLAALQERVYYENGEEHPLPLETLMGASNELPEDETLAPLYDRFLLRFRSQYIVEESAFKKMISYDGDMALKTRFVLDEIHQAQEEVRSVELGDSVLEAVVDIRRRLLEQGVMPSDRRYKEALRIVKAHAWFQGRDEGKVEDLSMLTNVLWDDPGQMTAVQVAVLDIANPLQKRAEELHDHILVIWSELQKVKEESEQTSQAIEDLAKLNKAIKELDSLRVQSIREDRPVERIDQVLTMARDIKKRIQFDYLGLEAE